MKAKLKNPIMGITDVIVSGNTGGIEVYIDDGGYYMGDILMTISPQYFRWIHEELLILPEGRQQFGDRYYGIMAGLMCERVEMYDTISDRHWERGEYFTSIVEAKKHMEDKK